MMVAAPLSSDDVSCEAPSLVSDLPESSAVRWTAVRLAWLRQHSEPPHSLHDFVRWYAEYIPSLELPDREKEAALKDDVRMWIDVCVNELAPPEHSRLCDLH